MEFVKLADSIDYAEGKYVIQNSRKMPGYTCPICGAQMALRIVNRILSSAIPINVKRAVNRILEALTVGCAFAEKTLF
jgi:hypothetical protein